MAESPKDGGMKLFHALFRRRAKVTRIGYDINNDGTFVGSEEDVKIITTKRVVTVAEVARMRQEWRDQWQGCRD